MKKNIILVLSSILLGVLFTFFILNKENIYAKEDYTVYAFQTGAYSTYDKAYQNINNISSIIVSDNNLYKIYCAIYKDMDLVNKMLNYYRQKNINIYLKQIKVSANFLKALEKYEELLKKVDDNSTYEQINQSILNLYLESIGGHENI